MEELQKRERIQSNDAGIKEQQTAFSHGGTESHGDTEKHPMQEKTAQIHFSQRTLRRRGAEKRQKKRLFLRVLLDIGNSGFPGLSSLDVPLRLRASAFSARKFVGCFSVPPWLRENGCWIF